MWRDISNEVSIWKRKIIHENQHVGHVEYGLVAVKKAGYRMTLKRGIDQDGYFNQIFIEKDFDLNDLQKKISQPKQHTPSPFQGMRKMKFIDATHKGKDIFISVDAIMLIERLMENRCRVTLKTGVMLELDYDAKRIRTKIEELHPASFERV